MNVACAMLGFLAGEAAPSPYDESRIISAAPSAPSVVQTSPRPDGGTEGGYMPLYAANHAHVRRRPSRVSTVGANPNKRRALPLSQ